MTLSPRRPLPTRPAIPAHTLPRGPVTPPNRTPPCNINVEDSIRRLDTHPNASYPQSPGDHEGMGTPHEEATDANVSDSPAAFGPRHLGMGYTSSQPLLDLEDIPVFPIQHDKWSSPSNGEVPAPYPWELKFLPEQWVYTDGSAITGHPRLGAVVVHIPTSTIPFT